MIRVMKITSFSLTIQQSVDKQGYGDNFYINIDDKGLANISRPYKSIPIEEQLAIEEVITAAIKAHLKLVKQVDNANKDLKLEEYRPVESVAETSSESTVLSTDEPAVGTTQTESIGVECEIKDAPFEDPERPFGLSEEQIAVLKANKGTTDEDIFGE